MKGRESVPARDVRYECPVCCRVAPWTDGRSVAAGDEADEFWCQTCGAESPLSACGKAYILGDDEFVTRDDTFGTGLDTWDF
jgi:hypothetical protein